MIKLGRRELAVIRVVSRSNVHELGGGCGGTAWKLQLGDYRRIVVLHPEGKGAAY